MFGAHLAGREKLDHGWHEVPQILRAAAGEPVAIPHQWQVVPTAAGMDDVVSQAGPRREVTPHREFCRNEQPGAVAQSSDRLFSSVDRLYELACEATLAQKIRADETAG